jgi:hypothetical protein
MYQLHNYMMGTWSSQITMGILGQAETPWAYWARPPRCEVYTLVNYAITMRLHVVIMYIYSSGIYTLCCTVLTL